MRVGADLSHRNGCAGSPPRNRTPIRYSELRAAGCDTVHENLPPTPIVPGLPLGLGGGRAGVWDPTVAALRR